jgi:hypothetical protein
VQHIIQRLEGIPFHAYTLDPFDAQEAKNLVITMEKWGLTSTKDLAAHSTELAKDPIAIAVCRAMNDFRPAEDIVRSLIKDSDNSRIERYVACALSAHCYRAGLA